MKPRTESEFAECLRSADTVWHATDPRWDVVAPSSSLLDFGNWTGFTHYSPQDLVISVRSGTRLSELQTVLAEHGQFLPLGDQPLCGPDPDMGTAIGFALPHRLESRFGSWREWILGMTVMLGDGVVAKSGSKVVKSVAGYDAHKLFVGARGSFGVILEVTLRVWAGRAPVRSDAVHPGRPWIQRCLRTDFDAMISGGDTHLPMSPNPRFIASDPETATIWAITDEPLPRFPHDWVLQGSPGVLEWMKDETSYLLKAKQLLDPQNKLNPGALGIC